jgi:hypothetical protein
VGGHYYLKKSPNWVLPSASIQPSFASDAGEETVLKVVVDRKWGGKCGKMLRGSVEFRLRRQD